MKIKLSDLRYVSNKLFDYLESLGQDNIEIHQDYYWNITEEELYNLSSSPSDFTMGQLSDNWAELEKIMSSNDPPVGYALVWLAAILRNIGEEGVG